MSFKTVAEDAPLLKGNAPNPAEWKEAWVVLSETMSLRKAGRLYEKQKTGSTPVANRKR